MCVLSLTEDLRLNTICDTHSSADLHNMEGALKVLLLAALILLVTAQTNYRSLPGVYRQHIDKALKEANGKFGKGHHVAFQSIIDIPKVSAIHIFIKY